MRDSGSRCDVRRFDILGRGDFDEKMADLSAFPRGVVIGCFDHIAKISDGEKLPSGAALAEIKLQGSAKRWTPGCVNAAGEARPGRSGKQKQ